MEDCLETHLDCRYLFEQTPLPTRLIDIRSDNGVEAVCLIESKTLPPTTHYSALSHVWGTRPFLLTILATLTDRQWCISLSDMPANFVDAINTTRSFKFGISLRLNYRLLATASLEIRERLRLFPPLSKKEENI